MDTIDEMIWLVGLLPVLLGTPVASVLLAQRKHRNEVSWFFLSLFWNFMTLIILACSKVLDDEKGENDTLAKVLWTIIISPLIVFIILFIIYKVMF